MTLVKALIQIVAVYAAWILIPNAILAYLQRSTDEIIDDFCREEHKRNEERRNGERKDNG